MKDIGTAPPLNGNHHYYHWMKKLVKDGKEFVELPKDLQGKKIMLIRIDEGLYVFGAEEKVQELVKKQVDYLVRKKGGERRPRVIKRPEVPEKGGFWVFDTEQEAAVFSRRHAEEFQSGEILGIKGFDGKYYAVRKSLYESVLPRVLEVLREKPMSADDVAVLLKKDKKLIKGILELAREEGLVIERSGGVYEYAG